MEHKRIAFINSTSGGSTGNIARKLIKEYPGEAKLFCFFGSEDQDVIKINISKISDIFSHSISRIDGKDGFHYHSLTNKLIKELDTFKPDIIHIHNLHGYYLNVPLLFDYINKNKIEVIWTLHDFWALTGRCAIPEECTMFLNGCNERCPNRKNYPYAIVHNEKKLYKKKVSLLSSLNNVQIVTPSEYLMDFVKQTYLNKYPLQIINNGIDLSKFYFEESDLKQKLKIKEDKIVLLDVMLPVSYHKGITFLNKLADELDDKYQIVLIGKNEDNLSINKKILHIPFIKQEELHLYYSFADIYINPTISDNYPTVDMEAISCHLPVISFDTGGSKEIVKDNVGQIIKKKDYEAFKKAIESFKKEDYKAEDFEKRRKEFDEAEMVKKYFKLYK